MFFDVGPLLSPKLDFSVLQVLLLRPVSPSVRPPNLTYFCPMAQQPPVGQGFLIVEAVGLYSVIHTTLGRTPLEE